MVHPELPRLLFLPKVEDTHQSWLPGIALAGNPFLLSVRPFFSGLTGKFTLASKLEILIVGLLGTFLLNIGRLSLIFVLFYNFTGGVAQAFHDYGSVILTIGWLFALWYYAFHFVLQTKIANESE